MAGIRDKLIHDYLSVNVRIVWKTSTEDLPALIPQLDAILADLDSSGRDQNLLE